jgi:hypothetical protein
MTAQVAPIGDGSNHPKRSSRLTVPNLVERSMTQIVGHFSGSRKTVFSATPTSLFPNIRLCGRFFAATERLTEAHPARTLALIWGNPKD